MTTPKTTLWEYAPHTQTKHKILRRYLQAWFPILSKWHDRIIYFDGFAGPGQYTTGELGSPLIALELAQNHLIKFTGELVFVFVEEEMSRFQHLKRLLNQRKPSLPQNFTIELYQDKFHAVLSEALDRLDKQGKQIAPTFAFIDPFGFSGVPMDLIHRLLEREHTEAFIYFARNAINRFASHPQQKIRQQMEELFGGSEVHDVENQPNRSEWLRALYQKKLAEKSIFVRYFEIADQTNHPLYDLFFSTNNAKGHVKMKEAMWAVDEWGTFKFSDATVPEQTALFQPDPSLDLLPLILARGKGRRVLFERICEWVEDKTPFLCKHLRSALKQAEQQKLISVSDKKKDGTRRRQGTFPSGTYISFE